MTEAKKRTYQAHTVTPPALKPVQAPHNRGTTLDEQVIPQRVELENRQERHELVIRLIDFIKSI